MEDEKNESRALIFSSIEMKDIGEKANEDPVEPIGKPKEERF